MIGWRASILALPVLLSACLISDEPLVTSRNAVYPLPGSATGDAYHYDRDTQKWTYRNSFSLRRAGSEYILTENNDATPFLLTQIAPNEWLAQMGTSDGRYQYGLLDRNNDGSYSTYDLSALCDALDSRGYGGTGIAKREDDCAASSLSLLINAIRDDLPDDLIPDSGYIIHSDD